jgi:hypothetical protein
VKKQNYNELFTDDDDPIWSAPVAKSKGKKQRERIDGPFYLCSEAWANRAAEFAGQYLILALRLYRRWLKRKPDATSIAVTAAALAGPEGAPSGTARSRLVSRLEVGGLLKVERRVHKQATLVRVIDPPTRV